MKIADSNQKTVSLDKIEKNTSQILEIINIQYRPDDIRLLNP